MIQVLGIVVFVTFLWLVVNAFRRGGPAWGLVTLLVPAFGALVYGIVRWEDARAPFLAYLLASVVLAGTMARTVWQGSMELVDIARRQQSGAVSQVEAARQAATAMQKQLDRMREAGLMSDEDYEQALAQMQEELARMEADEPAAEPPPAPPAAPAPPPEAAGPTPAPGAQQRAEPAAGPHRPPEAAAAPPRPTALYRPPPSPRPRWRQVAPSDAARYLGRPVIVVDEAGRERRARLVAVREGRLVLERRLKSGAMTYTVPVDRVRTLRVR